MQQFESIIARFNEFGGLLISAVLAMLGGIILIVLLYRLVASLVKPDSQYSRVIKVFFGGVYAMILVLTVLVAAEEAMGIDVSGIAGVAILAVLVGSVVAFFAIPFLPRLPFVTGDMIQLKDIIGTVEAITAYQVVIRTFDGQIVYFPTALALTMPIVNYSHNPSRRVEMNIELRLGSDIERARAILLELMSAAEHTLQEPPPAVFVTGSEDGKVTLFAFCWVENANWFGTRDGLYVSALAALEAADNVTLALPRMELAREG